MYKYSSKKWQFAENNFLPFSIIRPDSVLSILLLLTTSWQCLLHLVATHTTKSKRRLYICPVFVEHYFLYLGIPKGRRTNSTIKLFNTCSTSQKWKTTYLVAFLYLSLSSAFLILPLLALLLVPLLTSSPLSFSCLTVSTPFNVSCMLPECLQWKGLSRVIFHATTTHHIFNTFLYYKSLC